MKDQFGFHAREQGRLDMFIKAVVKHYREKHETSTDKSDHKLWDQLEIWEWSILLPFFEDDDDYAQT